jgi:predicted nucleic acid-binding protein
MLGYAEVLAAFHLKLREGVLNRIGLSVLLNQFERECDSGAFQWLAFSEVVVSRLRCAYADLPESAHLRAGDTIDLACAAEHGFQQIYSNDQHVLATAQQFGLCGQAVT